MAGRPLTVTQKQVTAILKGAEKAGVYLEIRAEEGRVRFLPVGKPQDSLGVDRREEGYL